MKTFDLAPAAILLVLAVPAVQAQPAARARKPAAQTAPAAQAAPVSRLLDLDTNHDGKISRSEWKGNDVSFQMLDRNGDGVLSGDELGTGAPAAAEDPAAAFARLDRDHDGRLTRDEWEGGTGEFQALDHNADGVVSREEFLNLDIARARRERVFRWMDTNHDGHVTKAEWREDPARFARLDRNHDGVLTLEEYAGK